MKKINLFFIALGILVNGCSGQDQDKAERDVPPKECIALNDSAGVHLQRFENSVPPRNYRDKQLDTALYLLKEAVKCDSTYIIAYVNMADTYHDMNNLNAEMAVINRLILVSKGNTWFIFRKALLYKTENKIDSGKSTFAILTKQFDEQLKKDPENVRAIVNKIWIKAYSDGKDAGLKARDEEIKQHPEDAIKITNGTRTLEYLDSLGRREQVTIERY